jgi:hypothetical protein
MVDSSARARSICRRYFGKASDADGPLSLADKQLLPDLTHGEENWVWSDRIHYVLTDAIHIAAPSFKSRTSARLS